MQSSIQTRDHYYRITAEDFKDRNHVSIQWKGTDACIDIRCSCGHQSHYDGYFAYYYCCDKCGSAYALGTTVKLIPLTLEETRYVEDSTSVGFLEPVP